MQEWAGYALTVLLSALAALLVNERRLSKLETKVDLLFKDVSFAAAFAATATLHREDDRLRLDALIDSFRAGQLSREELTEFVRRLKEVELAGQAHEREAAEVLLRILSQRYRL